ncbi:GAF domain-containing protein [Gimesia panareensis]|uniref:GAF domain-containing protein n=1 Tax=Gimesia panareensis TaxID=2527978 RepID=UPI00118A97E7|nr:GAF domain-containing protein [Gimesia panareensis]QDU50377.1 Blue-light-activated protein [Gimesia panareensis]
MQRTSETLPEIRLILELISKGNSLTDTLTTLIEYLESKSNDMFCSILLLDEEGRLRNGAAPHLPEEYVRLTDGALIGPNVGSCGAAAYHNQQVVVTDIETDPLWKDFKDVALRFGLRACWSTPIRSSTGAVLGTFAIYYHEPCAPTEFHEQLIEQAVYLAAIAIEHVKIEQDLYKSEQESSRLRQQLLEAIESLTEGFAIYDAEDRLVMCNSKYMEVYRESADLLVPGRRFEDHIRVSAYRGQVADAVGREEEWVQERVRQHQNPSGSFRQQLGNGRWLMISEHKTAEGGISGVRTDITQQVLYEEKLRRSIHLIESIRTLLSQYISDANPDQVFEDLLHTFLNISESEAGFIVEVQKSEEGTYQLIPRANCFRPVGSETGECEVGLQHAAREFFEQQKLFERIVSSKEALIIDESHDDRPAGYAMQDGAAGCMKSFLVLPVVSQGELTGVAGLANRPAGYDASFVEFLKPLLVTAGTLLTAYRNEVRRQENERALQESEERFSKVFQFNPMGKVILSFNTGRVIDVNESFLKTTLYSREQIIGKTIHELKLFSETGSWDEILHRVHENDMVYEQETPFCINDGIKRIIQCSACMIESADEPLLLLMVKDITEQKQTEELNRQMQVQLQHSQKMKAIGQLAAGVAHEFNNILVGINLNADLLLLTPEHEIPEGFREPLRDIQKSGERAAELVKQLLAFGRKKAANTAWFDVNTLISSHQKMMQRILGKSVTLILNLCPDTGLVWGDEGEIEQALMNLVVNARDAMPEGGVLRIQTQNVNVTEKMVADHAECLPGAYTLMSVTDNGCGMAPEIVSHIFEPFFTTKPVTEGTGLGLSTVQRNLTEIGGFITVASEPGGGSEFQVYLPQHQRVNVKDQEETEAVAEEPVTGGSETILVCDDEPTVLSTVSALLERLGYTVIRALGPEEAIDAAARQEQQISLLCTDFNMPAMNGEQLVRRLTQVRPGLKVIYLSGIAEKIPESAIVNGSKVIQKPTKMGELAHAIRGMLDEGTQQEK